jgi:hypothetical protein
MKWSELIVVACLAVLAILAACVSPAAIEAATARFRVAAPGPDPVVKIKGRPRALRHTAVGVSLDCSGGVGMTWSGRGYR